MFFRIFRKSRRVLVRCNLPLLLDIPKGSKGKSRCNRPSGFLVRSLRLSIAHVPSFDCGLLVGIASALVRNRLVVENPWLCWAILIIALDASPCASFAFWVHWVNIWSDPAEWTGLWFAHFASPFSFSISDSNRMMNLWFSALAAMANHVPSASLARSDSRALKRSFPSRSFARVNSRSANPSLDPGCGVFIYPPCNQGILCSDGSIREYCNSSGRHPIYISGKVYQAHPIRASGMCTSGDYLLL